MNQITQLYCACCNTELNTSNYSKLNKCEHIIEESIVEDPLKSFNTGPSARYYNMKDVDKPKEIIPSMYLPIMDKFEYFDIVPDECLKYDYCNKPICDNCSKTRFCKCGKLVCDSHSRRCKKCGVTICYSCLMQYKTVTNVKLCKDCYNNPDNHKVYPQLTNK